MTLPPVLIRFVPLAFVLLWSTGFIGARFGLPYIEPFYLLWLRTLLTLLVFAGLIWVFRARWPGPRQALHQMVTGALVHGCYLGGVFAAIKWQLPAGVTAILVGLQPVLTAVLAWGLWGQRLQPRQWLGLGLGLAGVILVLATGLQPGQFDIRPEAVLAAALALIGISVGTLYQKRFGAGTDLLTGSFFQYLAMALMMGGLTYTVETQAVHWHPELIGALLWLVLGLSVSAILLLMLMIREGEVSRVASYFYLVPPVTALEAWWLFDEQLSLMALAGMLLAVAGVYLVLRVRPAA
ncbi:DMT family transporter [Marinobacterium weihaiense]|uniref:DMT family transporter n=1 Tax=Marinobacterium weihaiense TaxID=2851016 RepID=A0ABS6MEA0_9GAMM|nr:DMT family transporter [Marinobacterium weihaiense]MBV0934632.1 DMT family transporter [Marinobacterium weihaiense]